MEGFIVFALFTGSSDQLPDRRLDLTVVVQSAHTLDLTIFMLIDQKLAPSVVSEESPTWGA